MPTYDYRCTKCGHTFEVFHGISETAVRRCPQCKGRARRVPAGGGGLIFRGSGFYITDYRSKDYKEKSRQEKSGGSGGSGSGGSGSGGSGSGGPSAAGGTASGGRPKRGTEKP